MVLGAAACTATTAGDEPPRAGARSGSEAVAGGLDSSVAGSVDEPADGQLSRSEPETGITARVDLDPTGNRFVSGMGNLVAGEPIDIALPGRAKWILPLGPGRWAVVLGDGRVLEVGGDGEVTELDPVGFPIDEAPLLIDTGVAGESESASGRSASPARYPQSAAFEEALPDTRVVYGDGFAVALVQPTDRYPHGVLGDRLEAAAIQVVPAADRDPRPSGEGSGTATTFGPEPPTVIEGISPMLADIDGDGALDVLVTQSNADRGAWLAAWTIDGRLLAESEAIGRGNRWRNQLAVAPVGPDGEVELIDVRTPHIGGIVEWFRYIDGELIRVATRSGFSNHSIGSRNLDLGIVADADGDGSLDVVLPTNDRTELGILSRTADGAAGSEAGVEVVARVALGGRISTNLAAAAHDGRVSFAAGTESDTVRIWD